MCATNNKNETMIFEFNSSGRKGQNESELWYLSKERKYHLLEFKNVIKEQPSNYLFHPYLVGFEAGRKESEPN